MNTLTIPSPGPNIIIQFDKLRHNFSKFSSYATFIHIFHLRPPKKLETFVTNVSEVSCTSVVAIVCELCIQFVSLSFSLFCLPAFSLSFHISCTNLIEYTKMNVENDYYYCVALWLKVFEMRFDGGGVIIVVVCQSKMKQSAIYFQNFFS